MLSVVAFGIALASGTGAYLAVLEAGRHEEAHLRDAKEIISEANFPLTESVLRQMHGLSGAEFILLDGDNRIIRAGIPLDRSDIAVLNSLCGELAPPSAVTSTRVVTLGEKQYRADLLPARHSGGPRAVGSVLILFAKDRWWILARKVGWPSLASGVLAMLAGGLVAALLAGRLVRPIRAIENQTKTIAAGHFDAITVPTRDDEIADLATSINLMAERLGHYEEEVRSSERMRTLGQLGAGIAHQLRNSATGARMAIELHRRECATAAASESTAVALRELRLMESYIGRFLELGKSRPRQYEPVDLCGLVKDVLELVEPTCRHAGVAAAFHDRPISTIVNGDGQSLRQLLVNLVLNAVAAVERTNRGDARIVIELEKTADGTAVLRTMDSGAGPDAAICERLFEPFVTGKPDGTGLGLYVARQVAEVHGGSLRLERRDGMTCFSLEIPLAAEVE
jgi:signal transduction histidine kinase